MSLKHSILKRVQKIQKKSALTKYKINNLMKKELGIQSIDKNKQVIVSLTTFGKRIDYVYLTIESLMNQTMKPNKIILWLKDIDLKNREIPKNLKRLELRGLEIRILDEDLKSYAKLIYAYKEYGTKDMIITCDDDVLYPVTFMEDLYKTSQKYPNTIVAYRCHQMKKIDQKSFAPYSTWKTSKGKEPSFDIFPTGAGGILYPPNSLNEKLLDKRLILELAPHADDIWFKAMGLLNNTKTVMVYEDSLELPNNGSNKIDSLSYINNVQNQNDLQLKKVFDYFDLNNIID